MLKRRPLLALYEVRLICIVIRGSLTCQRYVDEVLHPHFLQIYQTDGSNFLFQQDNVSIPVIWQGTVCKRVMSPLTGLPSPDPSPIGHPFGILGPLIHDRIPSQLSHFQNLNTSRLNIGNIFHARVGYDHWLLLSMHKKPHRMHP